MSVKDEQTKNLEEMVVVNQNEATEMVDDKEAKKAKLKNTGKKVLKVAGVAAVGVIGYLLGSKASKKCDYDDSEYVDVIDSDEE